MSISVQNLTKRFDAVAAVQDVSFEVPQNSFFVIVGASGCGKSTLLRLIAGLEELTEGSIALQGNKVAGPDLFLPPEQRSVGVVFQSYALWPHLTVEGNVAFPYEAQGLRRADAKAKAADHIRTVSLEPLKDRKPAALSGGQRQRVALARCLAGEAQTILMDEPLANLDPHLRHEMEAELKAFHKRAGVTTLYITHDQREAMALADVMAVMDGGRFLQFGRPEDIYDRPQCETVATFIGRGAVVEGIVQGGAVHVGGQMAPGIAGAVPPSGPVKILVRPNQVCVAPDGLPACLTSVLYRGGVWEVSATVEGLAEPIVLDLNHPAREGDRLSLKLTGGWVLPA